MSASRLFCERNIAVYHPSSSWLSAFIFIHRHFSKGAHPMTKFSFFLLYLYTFLYILYVCVHSFRTLLCIFSYTSLLLFTLCLVSPVVNLSISNSVIYGHLCVKYLGRYIMWQMVIICCWCYSLQWTLAFSTIALHWSWSRVFHLQFLTPFIFRSSIEPSHLIAGLPTHQVPSGLWTVNFLQGFCSWILKRCPSHLNLPDLITFIIPGSLYNLYSSWSLYIIFLKWSV
jgi:hypothetical protein